MRRILNLILIALLAGLLGCGDATRNDQGVSFTFLGWFNDITGGEAATAVIVPISSDADSIDENTILYAGIQNNLAGQFINVNSIRHEYYIPGAEIQVPSTTYGLSLFLGPAEGGQSTLPEGFTQGADGFAQTFIMTPEIMSFIQLNREYLPEPPFTMVVTSRITGTTSSGKKVTTNPIQFAVEFVSDIPVNSGGGAADGGVDPAA